MNLIGRLGAEPQVAKDKQGRDILIYSVATSERAPPAADGGEFAGRPLFWKVEIRSRILNLLFVFSSR